MQYHANFDRTGPAPQSPPRFQINLGFDNYENHDIVFGYKVAPTTTNYTNHQSGIIKGQQSVQNYRNLHQRPQRYTKEKHRVNQPYR
jgi:hypothetical protein